MVKSSTKTKIFKIFPHLTEMGLYRNYKGNSHDYHSDKCIDLGSGFYVRGPSLFGILKIY
ncbi:MAG: hypothetical protein OM95_02275 [Bdellovibrio sp. ArHS]|nr:MAG: hypothetical protein OM95_02275 [Bdellovibrio sp. ArHS]